jgi:hypothetical protein
MLKFLNNFTRCKILASDGDIGSVHTVFFDDVSWNVRYLVARTGTCFANRSVLITPVSIGRCDWQTQTVRVRLTREQVRSSPDIDTAKPVSRIHEIRLQDYYQWPIKALAWGLNPVPMMTFPPLTKKDRESLATLESESDPHLRNAALILKYEIESSKENFGRLEDFAIDDEHWHVEYLIAHSGILIPVRLVQAISWAERTIRVS